MRLGLYWAGLTPEFESTVMYANPTFPWASYLQEIGSVHYFKGFK